MARRAYHHGNLREGLIDAALDLLERGGPSAVGLRAVARVLGVSAAAPYAHFADKRDLMTAVAAAGFRKLRESLAVQSDGGLHEPAARYVDFALGNPGLYSLMFGSSEHIDPQHPELRSASRDAFASLRTRTAEPATAQQAEVATLAAWSLAHGLAMLLINQKLQPGRRALLPQMLRLQAAD